MGNDDESSNPRLCSEVAGGVTRNIVCLFREPDAGNLPVRFHEREQETGPGQTGLRRAQRKPNPTATGRLQLLRLFSTLLVISLMGRNCWKIATWSTLRLRRLQVKFPGDSQLEGQRGGSKTIPAPVSQTNGETGRALRSEVKPLSPIGRASVS
jgi:hypothetical protein